MKARIVPQRRLLVLVASIAAVLAAGGAGAHGAGAKAGAHVACGQLVTVSITLDSDLNCTGDGLVVGASGITINLHGNTIDGDDGAGDVGIDNTGGFDGVTIANGTLTDFAPGVRLVSTVGNRLARLEVRSSLGTGVDVVGGDHTLIVESLFVDNGGIGITLRSQSDDNRIEGNSVVGNVSEGIDVSVSDRNVIARNEVTQNTQQGIEIGDSAGNVVDSNRVFGNGAHGVFTSSVQGTRVTRNQIIGNAEGVTLENSDSTHLEGNVVSGNADNGITVTGDSDQMLVHANTTIGNGSHGISVDSSTPDSLLAGNLAVGNAVDGIESDSPSSRFRHNTANANGDLGIDAEPGSTDLGFNHARANVDPTQCTVIACS
jgi:parallel beta-helix repeat protein